MLLWQECGCSLCWFLRFGFKLSFQWVSLSKVNNNPDGKTYREVELTNLDGKGPGKIIIDNGNKIIEANDFTNGQAQGPGKMFIKQNTGNPNDDFFLTGTFQNGCLESRVLGYSYLPLFDDKDVPILSNDTVLFYIATYAKGIPVGPIWRQSEVYFCL